MSSNPPTLATPETSRRAHRDSVNDPQDEQMPDEPVTPTPNPPQPRNDGLGEIRALFLQQQAQIDQMNAARDAEQHARDARENERFNQMQQLMQQAFIHQHQPQQQHYAQDQQIPEPNPSPAENENLPHRPDDQPPQYDAPNSNSDMLRQLAQIMTYTNEQTNANITASMRAHTSEQQSGPGAKRAEESRLNSLASTNWTRKDKLTGHTNYGEWKKSMLTEATYLESKDVLIGNRHAFDPSEMGRHSWDVKSRLLHARLAARMNPEVARAVHLDDTLTPSVIWVRLENLYRISRAEERLSFTKTALNLTPQSNPIEMLYHWEALYRILKDREYEVEEIFHDIAIILLGDWQKTFLTAQLDDLFTKSKRDEQHMFDIPDLIAQLNRRYTNPGSYQRMVYTEYRPEPRGPALIQDNRGQGGSSASQTALPRSRDPNKSTNTSSNQALNSTPNQNQPARSITPRANRQTCSICHKGYHDESQCWVAHPELRPSPRNQAGTANFVNKKSHHNDWIFDTGTSYIITKEESAFDSFIPLNHVSTVDLPDGSNHCIHGVDRKSVV